MRHETVTGCYQLNSGPLCTLVQIMTNDFFDTFEKKETKHLLNEAIATQTSCKGLLNNWNLGESRG
ncbi:hypothetical protein JHD49_08510 [Sulfurimonas sp. SAG-AH-194-C21]|nr:hypothetical protein [Sulfurimonas sp. SAG-AH-194-C21]MDF1883977.1 hypothetical protein [Sulfurimonas sp. SAG-AH-194-C21]